jgi:uncharacterized protein
MNQSSKLYRLQQIDSLQDQAIAQIEELDKNLSNLTALDQAEQVSRSAEENLENEQKKLRQAENQVKDQRLKIEQNEAALYSGKMHNPKELQDLQNEVASLKRYLSVLEDRQIEAMISAEEAESVAQQAKASLETVRGQTIETQSGFRAEKARLFKNQERLEIERQAASNALSVQELELYNQLRKQRRGIAVTKVVNRTCEACGSTLTPALVQAASAPNQIVRCSSCGRILYPG